MPKTILVTNGLLNKTLAVVRSLGKQNFRVLVAEKTRIHVSGYSKYAHKSLVYPDPVQFKAAFLEWLKRTIRQEKVDLVLPTDDDPLKVIVTHQEELSTLTSLIVPSLEAYELASNKAQTYELAEKLGIPYPKTRQTNFAAAPQDQAILEFIRPFTFPIIIKPTKSSGSRGIRVAHSAEECLSLFKEVHRSYPNPVLQEWIPPGPKYDVGLLLDPSHRTKAVFLQKELRNFPIPMGPSSACLSVSPNVEMTRWAEHLLTELDWVGVADVEFMVDPRDGTPKLMEINPRFWSSLYLAIDCGVDFPYLLTQVALGHNSPPVTHYREKVVGRSLFPNDLLHFMSSPNRKAFLKKTFWANLEQDELLSREDPFPLLGFFLSALQLSVRPSTWRFLIRR